jgi:hypothetical protein
VKALAEVTSTELHEELAVLYRGKSVDYPQINRYWAAIEKKEAEENG